MSRRKTQLESRNFIRLAYLAIGSAIAFSGNNAFAQSNIVPDDTLGNQKSKVIGNFGGLPVELIEGGAKRGANLFHSFREFNVSEGRGAYFTNPSGVENILSRVTGTNPSNILGTLGVLGNASGEGGGEIQLQGRNITLTNGSTILVETLGSQSGGQLPLGQSS
jgi:large exoprotein involved in heme utilization and adhesion